MSAAVAQDSATTSVTLAWDANLEPDVIGYRLYVGTESGIYTTVYDSGSSTTFTVPDLATDLVYFLAVTAYTADGLESSDSNEVAFSATNQPPTISITSPVEGTSVDGASTLIVDTSSSDIDGSVSKVELYEGSQKVGESTTSSFSFDLRSLGAGTHTFSAVAYDDEGASTISAPVSVTVTVVPLRAQQLRQLDDGTFELTLEGAVGQTIQVYASSDLVNWTLLGSAVNSNGQLIISDPDAAASPQRFYRGEVSQ